MLESGGEGWERVIESMPYFKGGEGRRQGGDGLIELFCHGKVGEGGRERRHFCGQKQVGDVGREGCRVTIKSL